MARGKGRESERAKVDVPRDVFGQRLGAWYRESARVLPWRQTSDPYRIWVSEIMLQQTRVGAVVDHYNRFVEQFPTVVSLSLAREDEVLAAWSGLGYYRRARMLHKAAQFLVREHAGVLPGTSAELRMLPGIGDYTAAAIASIAFGESVAVVDGNVERVIIRLTGDGSRGSLRGAAMRKFIREQAQGLMPTIAAATQSPSERNCTAQVWSAAERLRLAAAAHPGLPAGENARRGRSRAAKVTLRRDRSNAAGDHNQAMMELGATICLPRAPLCDVCPVQSLCATRGEHNRAERPKPISRPAAYLLELRKSGTAAEVLLERRPLDASLMAGMLELPALPLESVEGREPVLRVRHAITNTNYYVQIYTSSPRATAARGGNLRRVLAREGRELLWVKVAALGTKPLTGLARKVLHRLKVMDGVPIELLR